MKVFLLMIVLFSSSVSFSDTSRLYHRLGAKSSIVEIFTRLNLYPLYGEKGYVTKTLKLNPIIKKMGTTGLPEGFLVRLPPLPIKESYDWFIEGDMLVFVERGAAGKREPIRTHAANYNSDSLVLLEEKNVNERDSSLIFSASLMTTLEETSLKDQNARVGKLRLDRSWGINAGLKYRKKSSTWHLDFRYEDMVYRGGETIRWFENSGKRLRYQASFTEQFRKKYLVGIGVGKTDVLSFKGVPQSTLSIVKLDRIYAHFMVGWNFSAFIPIESVLELRVLESLKSDEIKFDIAYELLLSLMIPIRMNQGADIFIISQLGYRDDNPQGFEQESKFAYLGFGFRWGGE